MYSEKQAAVIIAETAFNHEGDKEYLLKLVEEVSLTGVTHIKFQILIDYDEFVSLGSDTYELTKDWCFDESQWKEILDYAEEKGLRLFLMPLDCAAVQFCLRSSVDFVEIHSVSFNDDVLKKAVFESLNHQKLVFGLGGRTKEEVLALKGQITEDNLLLMHGFQAFPSKLKDVKLARLKYLRESFPESDLGYADHSAPETLDAIYSSMYAYHLGARFFEKHVSLCSDRTDAQSALTPVKLKDFVSEVRRFESIVDDVDDVFDLGEKELIYRNRQKQVVASKSIKRGTLINESDVALKMHTKKGAFTRINEVCGKIAISDYSIGDVILDGE